MTVAVAAATYTISIYSDAACLHLVGLSRGTVIPDTIEILAQNGSGLQGTLSLDALTVVTGAAPVRAQWNTAVETRAVVYNHDDAAHHNTIFIEASSVTGDLPAPVRIEVENLEYGASSTNTFNVYLALNVNSDPGMFTHILEGEGGAADSVVNDANSSGGQYGVANWTGITESLLYSWSLTETLITSCSANYFRLLGRLPAQAYSNLWLRWRVLYETYTVWEGPQFLAGTNALQDMGVIQLPPYLVGAGDLQQLELNLYGQMNTAGSHSINLDFVQLSPLDGWRAL
jgi:hypothetical protein